MCLYPALIDNPKYKPNQKNGGHTPPVLDPRTKHLPVPCGNCMECMKNKARDWLIRLTEDIKYNQGAKFITLTFSNDSIYELSRHSLLKGYTLDNFIATKATRLFLERWRKTCGKSLRHWLVTELGHHGTENIHLHGLIWLREPKQIHDLDNHWKYGFTWKGHPQYKGTTITDYNNYVNENTIAYITKYVTKIDHDHQTYKPIILTSPGIGADYVKQKHNIQRHKFNEANTVLTYKSSTGHEIELPQYYKDKLYTDQEKEALWLHKLDENTRYVLGNKIDITNGLQTYFKILKQARERNKQLGYRTRITTKEQKDYELKARIILQETRIAAAKAKRCNDIMARTTIWPEAPF